MNPSRVKACVKSALTFDNFRKREQLQVEEEESRNNKITVRVIGVEKDELKLKRGKRLPAIISVDSDIIQASVSQ